MNPSPFSQWPPLIERGKVPRFVRIRDILLTILAWFILLWLAKDFLYSLYDYLAHPHFAFSRTTGPDWVAIWQHLEGFIYLALFLMLWLVFWGFVRRHDLRRIKDSAQPPPLRLDELAARRGLNPERLAELRDEKIVVVHFDGEHRVSSVVPKPLPRAS
jgi:poly-beta-1,6-N-acetyl-D-glucosamine biosynthesis protein PgaD